MTKEQLQQHLDDLIPVKKDLARQVSSILAANQISSRGKNRIIQSLVNFPDTPVKIIDTNEAALVNILFQAKNVQLAMLTIQKAIAQTEQEVKNVEV